jgi:hypothetical protein
LLLLELKKSPFLGQCIEKKRIRYKLKPTPFVSILVSVSR